MTVCPTTASLQLLLDGDLESASAQDLEAHLESCPACRQRLEQLRSEGATSGSTTGQFGADPEETATFDQSSPAEAASLEGTPAASRYCIDRFLAKGNLGEVFVAIDKELQREVALELRSRALAWLQEDLDVHENHSLGTNFLRLLDSESAMKRWLDDPDLASLRDLQDLPADQQATLEAFWARVRQALAQTEQRYVASQVNGQLSPAAPKEQHTLNAVAGDSYTIEMESSGFDCMLYVMDGAGEVSAGGCDFMPGQRRARRAFTPRASGEVHVVADIFKFDPQNPISDQSPGSYHLTIRHFRAED